MPLQVVKKGGEFDRIKVELKALDKMRSRVGWFENMKYPDGTPVAYVGAIQEFGYAAGGIPPRPFFRPTIAAQQNNWKLIIADGARRVIKGGMTSFQALERLGLQAEGDVRKTISQITTPPLSLLTLMARKARLEHDKSSKKQYTQSLKYGPQRPIAGFKMTGKMLGQLAKQQNAGPPDVSGVNNKPLVDTRVLINTLTSVTENK